MNTVQANIILEQIKWDANGLVCAIVQDIVSKRVLMVAWMNAEAVQKTIQTGYAHYYSRSRQRQWQKGEESGHTQQVKEIFLDCDGDALLLLVKQNGGIACHTGRESCFFRLLNQHQWVVVDKVIKDESHIYQKGD